MTRVTATLLLLLVILNAPAEIAMGQEPKADGAKEMKAKPPPPLAERVKFQFNQDVKDTSLCLFGPDVNSMVFVQPEGLRFNIPAGRKSPGNVGVESRLRLRGDFEITLEYELLAMPDPGPQYSAGPYLQIALDAPDDLKVRIGRTRKAARALFGAEIITLGPNGKNVFKGLSASPADDKEIKGRLRLVRTGDALSCQIQEGGSEFRAIATKDIGHADVIAVQAQCLTSWQPVALDIRFARLEMHASAIPNKEPGHGERVEFQLREGVAKHPMLRFVGPDAESMAVAQPQGLRFNVPAGRENTGDVGVEARPRLQGDFVITLEYELAALPDPPPKQGAGAVLQIVLDSPDARKARLDRLHRLTDDVFGANCVIDDKFRGLAAPRANGKETKGSLRMVRTDKSLSYQVQEGGVPFYEIARYEIGSDDVIAVQALCATGWQPVPVGICFPRLELRSSKTGGAVEIVPVPADPPNAARPEPGGRTSLLIVIGLGLMLFLLAMFGISIYLWSRLRRRP